jgi:hypothetical protein
VIKVMLEHGELVSICLGELYDELLRLEQEGLPRIRPQRPIRLLLDLQRQQASWHLTVYKGQLGTG